MDTIQAVGISKTYTIQDTEVILNHAQRPVKTRTVLKDISLEFPIGKITVIVGRSGCGKSTLLKILDESGQPDSGEVRIPEGWHTTMLYPDPYVITWTSVLRNVEMAAGAGRSPEERRALAEKLIGMVGLEEFSDMTPAELSTGMKQRLGLARVLASRAQVLLMDEPFAALDFVTRAELQQRLLEIQKEMPRTIVLVTHQLDEAVLLAQKIIVMHADSSVREFDMTGIAYPRDLFAPDILELKEQITEECRKA